VSDAKFVWRGAPSFGVCQATRRVVPSGKRYVFGKSVAIQSSLKVHSRTGFGGENLVHPDRPGSKSPHGPPFHGHNLALWKPRTSTSGSCYGRKQDFQSLNAISKYPTLRSRHSAYRLALPRSPTDSEASPCGPRRQHNEVERPGCHEQRQA
jgi:hypothetical protein